DAIELAGDVLDREHRAQHDGAAVDAALALESTEHPEERRAGRDLDQQQPVRGGVLGIDRPVEGQHDGRVGAGAAVLPAARGALPEERAHAVEAWHVGQAARAEAVWNDDGSVAAHQPIARERVARIGWILLEDALRSWSGFAPQAGSRAERRAGTQPSAERAQAAGGDEGIGGAAPERTHR